MPPEQAEQERARQLALQKALQLVMRLEDALSLFSTNVVRTHHVTLSGGELVRLLELAVVLQLVFCLGLHAKAPALCLPVVLPERRTALLLLGRPYSQACDISADRACCG